MSFLDDVVGGVGEFVADPLGNIKEGADAVGDFVTDKVVDPVMSGVDKAGEWVTDNVVQPFSSGMSAGSVTHMATGHNDNTISNVTIGISHSGMEQYIDNLKVEVLDNMTKVINDTQALETAINVGWQGKSRDRWMEMFNKMREEIVADLSREYYDLKNRFEELEDNYFAQDDNMVDLI